MDKTQVNPQDFIQYRVKIVFDMNRQEIPEEPSFKISVRESICNALDLPPTSVIPGDLHDYAMGQLKLDFVMFGPRIKTYITKLYDEISNPSSIFRQHKYTRKTITAEVSRVYDNEECVEAERLMAERDAYKHAATLAFQDFLRLQAQSEATRKAALEAEKAVQSLQFELQSMEHDFEELSRLASDPSLVRAAETNLADFKRNLREHMTSATTTASLARTLMEDVAKARQDAELKSVACDQVSRRWAKACLKCIAVCDDDYWVKELRRYEQSLYVYESPNGSGFVGGFFDVCNHFGSAKKARGGRGGVTLTAWVRREASKQGAPRVPPQA